MPFKYLDQIPSIHDSLTNVRLKVLISSRRKHYVCCEWFLPSFPLTYVVKTRTLDSQLLKIWFWRKLVNCFKCLRATLVYTCIILFSGKIWTWVVKRFRTMNYRGIDSRKLMRRINHSLLKNKSFDREKKI